MVQLTLPWPPTVNTYWRQWRGRMILSAKGREYRQRVLGQLGERSPLLGRLAVQIAAYPPDKRRRDLDNLHKGILDALGAAGIYADDSQIDELRIIRREIVSGGEIYVEVTEL